MAIEKKALGKKRYVEKYTYTVTARKMLTHSINSASISHSLFPVNLQSKKMMLLASYYSTLNSNPIN